MQRSSNYHLNVLNKLRYMKKEYHKNKSEASHVATRKVKHNTPWGEELTSKVLREGF